MRYLEEWLDEYVKGIALVSARTVEGMDMVTEDNRKERGDYDDFFKIKKKEHHGTLEERMVNLEQDLKDYQEMLEVFVQALDQARLGDARRLGTALEATARRASLGRRRDRRQGVDRSGVQTGVA